MPFRPLQDSGLSLSNLQHEINHLIERVWREGLPSVPFLGQWSPAIDLYEYPDRYVLYAEVPGLEGGDVDLSYLDNVLTVRGERCAPEGVGDDANALRKERRFGTFCRTVDLPGGIEADRMSATCHAGVLEVTIPKSEATRPKSIKVEIGES